MCHQCRIVWTVLTPLNALCLSEASRAPCLYSLGGPGVFTGWPRTHSLLRSSWLRPCANPQVKKFRAVLSFGSTLQTSHNGAQIVLDACLSLFLNPVLNMPFVEKTGTITISQSTSLFVLHVCAHAPLPSPPPLVSAHTVSHPSHPSLFFLWVEMNSADSGMLLYSVAVCIISYMVSIAFTSQ